MLADAPPPSSYPLAPPGGPSAPAAIDPTAPLPTNLGGGDSTASRKTRWAKVRNLYDKIKTHLKNGLHKLSPRRLFTPTLKVEVASAAPPVAPTSPVGGGDGAFDPSEVPAVEAPVSGKTS